MPSTSAIAPFGALAAPVAVGWSLAVAFFTSGVRSAMQRDIVGWLTLNISA